MSNAVSNLAAGLGLNVPARVAEHVPDRTAAPPRKAKVRHSPRPEPDRAQVDRSARQARDPHAVARPHTERTPAAEAGKDTRKDFEEVLKKHISSEKKGENEGDSTKKYKKIQKNPAFVHLSEPATPVAPPILTTKTPILPNRNNTQKSEKASKPAFSAAKQASAKGKQIQNTPIKTGQDTANPTTKTRATENTNKAGSQAKDIKGDGVDRPNIKEIAPETTKTAKKQVNTTPQIRSHQPEGPAVKTTSEYPKGNLDQKPPITDDQPGEKPQTQAHKALSATKTTTSPEPGKQAVQDSGHENESKISITGGSKKNTSDRADIRDSSDRAGAEAEAVAVKVSKDVSAEDAAKPGETVVAAAKEIADMRAGNEQQSTTPVRNAGAPRSAGFVADGVKSPGEQVIESIRLNVGAGRRQIEINLHPSELGSVRIRLGQENGQITGVLEVDKPQTRYEIEKEIPEIVASLQSSGLQVKRVEVVLNQQPNQGDSGRNRGDDFDMSTEERFETSSQGASDSQTGSASGDNSENDYPPLEQREAQVSDEAINVYV